MTHPPVANSPASQFKRGSKQNASPTDAIWMVGGTRQGGLQRDVVLPQAGDPVEKQALPGVGAPFSMGGRQHAWMDFLNQVPRPQE